MYPFLKRFYVPYGYRISTSYFSSLLDSCLSSQSLNFVKAIHALLTKVGLDSHTFLGNRCLDLYSRFGTLNDASKAFDGIVHKNSVSWNIYLKALLRNGHLVMAHSLFDDMPERDVVSWNSMISGYASMGYLHHAFGIFSKMQNSGVRPSEFTFSILISYASCVCYAKQIHAGMLRNGLNLSNIVLGNSLIDTYGKLGLVDYALGVFLTMENVDIISWNSLISACYISGYTDLALDQFSSMKSVGQSPDEFTISTMITVCSNLLNLDMGMQILAYCVKVGFFSNTIVSGAAIDFLSKCSSFEHSLRLFEQLNQWDSVLCDTMISVYCRHGFGKSALQLLVLTLREGRRPSGFTLSSILSSIPILPVEQGSQIHSLVVKVGLESDSIVANSLVEMYTKFGLIDSALIIFNNVAEKDLISWNTVVMGLARNGRVVEALKVFQELLRRGLMPDQITLDGVLLACNLGNLVDEGLLIFLSMEYKYGVKPENEHSASIVELLTRVGRVGDAMNIINTMPHEPSSEIWEAMLYASEYHQDLKVTEKISRRLIELEPHLSLPYMALLHAYEMRGRWESMVRVKMAMREQGAKIATGCSWVGNKNLVFSFKEDQLQHHGGEWIFLMLRLLHREMEAEEHVN